MKKIFFLSFIAVSTLVFFSCKKDSTNTSSVTTWTTSLFPVGSPLDTASYTVFKNGTTLEAGDIYLDKVDIVFSGTPQAGTYTVINALNSGQPATPGSTECYLYVSINNSTGSIYGAYCSTGVSGNTVTVTISGGKIIAKFANIYTEIPNTTNTSATFTGTLIQQ